MDCNVCNNRTKALLVFTFQCYIICTFPADGSLYCQNDSVWTNLNDFLGSIKLAIFVVLRHLGILNPLSAPLQDLSLKNIRNHPLVHSAPLPVRVTRSMKGSSWCNPPPPWVFLSCTLNRLEYHAEIFYSWWGVLCATFGEKKFGQVRSGHEVMTSQREQPSARFQRNRE